MQFSEIIGLASIKQTLTQAVNTNHVAHAQLFQGQEGGGALAMAIAYSTYVLCSNKQTTDSCGQCASCLKMSKLAHPDVSYIFPTAGGKKVLSENFMNEWRAFVRETPYATLSDWLHKISIKQGNIPVEEARQLIQNLSLKSYEGGYKIVIIWQADLLNSAAANALLKLLEEPPEKTLLLLVSTNADRLLTTIISRTQRVVIRAFDDAEVEHYLHEKDGISTERAKQVAFLSEGNIAKALEIVNQEAANEQQWFAEWMRMCYAFKVERLVAMADEFDKLTKENQKGLLEYGLNIFREIFLFAYGGEQLLRLEGEELQFVQRFSSAINLNHIEKVTAVLSEAHFHIERNVRAKMVFLDSSLTIAQLMKK